MSTLVGYARIGRRGGEECVMAEEGGSCSRRETGRCSRTKGAGDAEGRRAVSCMWMRGTLHVDAGDVACGCGGRRFPVGLQLKRGRAPHLEAPPPSDHRVVAADGFNVLAQPLHLGVILLRVHHRHLPGSPVHMRWWGACCGGACCGCACCGCACCGGACCGGACCGCACSDGSGRRAVCRSACACLAIMLGHLFNTRDE